MKYLILLFFIASCAKYAPIEPTCQRVYYLVDKYNFDTVYLKTDTLWPFGRYANEFCNSDTLRFVNEDNPVFFCDDSTYELRRYVIGNKITTPRIFK